MEHVCTHTHEHLTAYQRASGYDPTHTVTLRNAFARDMRKRFRRLRGVIRQAIEEDDVFALKNEPTIQQGNMTSPGHKAFDFNRSKDKVDAFMEWLGEQHRRGVLEVGEQQTIGQAAEDAWTNKYINDSYKRGVQRGRSESKKAGYAVQNIEDTGGIQAVMSQPMHVDTVGLLYTRTFNELKGITEAMDQQISRVLARGIADGDNPRPLANKLNAVIKGGGADLGITDELGRFVPAQRRAEMLARTEVVRAHHLATMNEYENWQAQGVRVRAEWATASDSRVCARCASLQGSVYKLKEIRNMIPLHPRCRCVAIPIKPDEGEVAEEAPPPAPEPEIRELTDKEKTSVLDYAEGEYPMVNDPLRRGENFSSDIYKEISDNLSSAIQARPKYEGNVYRGMSFDNIDDYNEFMNQTSPGNYFVDRGFMSTSKFRDVAQETTEYYGGGNKVILKINAKGRNGVDFEEFGFKKDEYYEWEKEVLFNKDSQFKIESKEAFTDKDGERYDFIKLTEL